MARIGIPGIVRMLTIAVLACLVGATAFAGDTHQGKKAFLGVQIEEETEWSEGGARVTRVVGDSAAEEAGIEDGDIIVRFDGQTVRGPGGLSKAMRGSEPGERVEVVVVREGREQTFDVELGAHPARKVLVELDELDLSGLENLGERIRLQLQGLDLEDLEGLEDLDLDLEGLEDLDLSGLEDLGLRIREGLAHVEHCKDGDCKSFTWHASDRPLLGVHLIDATPELREHLGSDPEEGILIGKVIPDTPAEDADIRVGDLIVAIDGEAIEDAGDVRRALHGKFGERVEVEVIRDGRPRSFDVVFPDRD